MAVLVLSIGLLGLAALQARSLQGNAGSLQRTQGVVLTQHVLDLLRADRAGANAGNYNTGTDPVCQPADIPGSTLAAASLRTWLSALKDHLGQAGDASTCARVVCDTAGVCSVEIVWDDRRAGGEAAQTLSVGSRL